MRRVPSKHRNRPVAREREQGAMMRLALLLLCGLALATGFVFAGGKHFKALKLGYETEKLRAQLDSERDEQRRLLVQREIAASPARLELAARQLGMQPMQPAQIDPLKQLASVPQPKPSSPMTSSRNVTLQKQNKPKAPDVKTAPNFSSSTAEQTKRR